MKRNVLISLLLGALTTVALAAGVEETVNELIPKLADARFENRAAPQLELQSLAAKAGRPGAEAERAELAKVLCAKAGDAAVPQAARVWIVRQLEHLGTAETVPTLSALLTDPDAELREVARRALEKNPAPEAGATLRAALQKGGESRWMIGLISSLGQRRDAEAVALVKANLDNQETRAAAANALGKIATAPAVAALWEAAGQGSPVAAEAILEAANRLAQAGAVEPAATAYGRLYTSAKTSALRGAALIGLAKVASVLPNLPVNLNASIQEAVTGRDARLQVAGVTAAVLSGKTAMLTLMLGNLPPSAKAQTVRVLDRPAEGTAVAMVADENEVVRVAALETLGRIGSAMSVPALLKAATGDVAPEKTAAVASLARANGSGFDAAISQAAGQGEAKLRAAAINALAARNTLSAIPALLTFAADQDSTVAKAASGALGKMGTDAEIEPLARLVLTGKAPGADNALQAIASRSKDKSAAARKVVEMARAASGQELVSILDVLTLLGGEEAMTVVVQQTTVADAEVKDGAIRALCNWPDFAACRPLLELAAKAGAQQTHQILALQAVGRLVRGADTETAQARVETSLALLKTAQRDQEKRLAVGTLGSIKDSRAGEALLPFLADASLKTDAAQAALSLGDALRRTDRRTATKLAEAVKAAGISDPLTRRASELLTRISTRR